MEILYRFPIPTAFGRESERECYEWLCDNVGELNTDYYVKTRAERVSMVEFAREEDCEKFVLTFYYLCAPKINLLRK